MLGYCLSSRSSIRSWLMLVHLFSFQSVIIMSTAQREQQQPQPRKKSAGALPALLTVASVLLLGSSCCCKAFSTGAIKTHHHHPHHQHLPHQQHQLQQRHRHRHHHHRITAAPAASAGSPSRIRRRQLLLRRQLASSSTAEAAAEESNNNDEEEDDDETASFIATRKRQLSLEFLNIGVPALIQLAAEPVAALVDTAYLGRLGPEVLGGAGVAVSAQYAVGKLYNDPLLRTSISLVAAETGKRESSQQQPLKNGGTSSDDTDNDNDTAIQQHPPQQKEQQQDLSVAVSSALLLAVSVGVAQLLVYSVFCRSITAAMGVARGNPMWHSAVSYLQIRALGTPAATLWLVSNGIFRGLGDTRTPLLYSLAFTALNAVLDPIFIFTFGWGAAGAAAGTALAQYAALIPLLRALQRKVPFWSNYRSRAQWAALQNSLRQYLRAGGLILFRTLGKVLAYAVTARQSALLGSVAAAAYIFTFQLGFATTQICEAVAVAVQTLLARELAKGETEPRVKAQLVRHLINTSLLLGGGVATILSLTTYARRDWILRGLTTSPSIRAAAAGIFPVVLLTQVLKGLAYPVNGIIMGGLDWIYSMIVMWMANLACVGLVRRFAAVSGVGTVSLGQLWWALAAFMGTQVIAGIVRYESKTGVWKVLRRGDR